MGRHLDVDALLVGRGDRELVALDLHDAREHQVFVGVFVIDDEQAMLRRTVDRDEADIVVVVAELARLGFRRLVRRIELR